MSEEKGEKLSKYWVPKEPSPIATKGYKNHVEEQIEEAMAQGKFSNLPGKGKPLNLGPDHPWEAEDWMVNHLLSNAHVVPEWIELDKAIRAEVAFLAANRDLSADERAERTLALNRQIDKFNLVVPVGFLQKPRFRDT